MNDDTSPPERDPFEETAAWDPPAAPLAHDPDDDLGSLVHSDSSEAPTTALPKAPARAERAGPPGPARREGLDPPPLPTPSSPFAPGPNVPLRVGLAVAAA